LVPFRAKSIRWHLITDTLQNQCGNIEAYCVVLMYGGLKYVQDIETDIEK